MTPEQCRAVAIELRHYSETDPVFRASALSAARHLEAVAVGMEINAECGNVAVSGDVEG